MTTAYAHCLQRDPTKMLTEVSDILRDTNILSALSRMEGIDFGLFNIERGGGVTLATLMFTPYGEVIMQGTDRTETIAPEKVDRLFGNVYKAWIDFTHQARREHTIRDLQSNGLSGPQASEFAYAAAKLAQAEALREEALAVLDPIAAEVGKTRKARLLSHMADHLPPGNDQRALFETLSLRARQPRIATA